MAKPVHSPASRPSSPKTVTLLNAGRAALSTGAWSEAAEAFSRALELAPGPGEAAAEAWAGIGAASYWLGDGTTATSAYERAFREYRDLGRGRDAARMALWLTDIQFALFGAHAVANGWMEQASRLLAGSSTSVESLWLLAYRGHLALFGNGDAGSALALAREGQEGARALGTPEVEVVTLALEGLARVYLGEVAAGMARLDEASAAAVTRGLSDLNAVAWACCYLVHGCGSIRDLPRAEEWCRRVLAFCDEWGLAPLYASCRIDYAAVLTWRGAWDAAETELASGPEQLERASPGLEHVRNARFAELRRRQGRLDEAEEALRGTGEDPLAIVTRAAIALDRGDPEVALDLSERALRLLPEESWMDRVDAVLTRARAAAVLGDVDGAGAAARELEAAADLAGTALVRGLAAFARGLAARAEGDLTTANAALEEAVTHSDRGGAPFEAAQARLALAKVLAALGRRETARLEAARARRAFASLGAVGELARADAFLRSPSASPSPLTPRENEVLRLVARGWSNRRIASELFLSSHTVKRHVANILRKLGCPSRAAAVARGTAIGLLP